MNPCRVLREYAKYYWVKAAWHWRQFVIAWDGPLFALALAATAIFFVCVATPSNAQEPLLERVNLVVNQIAPCKVRPCHPLYPSLAELAEVTHLECTGYVMAKAYALRQLGVAPERMQIAVFDYMASRHAVLVVDRRVLDNFDSFVRDFNEYLRFEPMLIPVAWREEK